MNTIMVKHNQSTTCEKDLFLHVKNEEGEIGEDKVNMHLFVPRRSAKIETIIHSKEYSTDENHSKLTRKEKDSIISTGENNFSQVDNSLNVESEDTRKNLPHPYIKGDNCLRTGSLPPKPDVISPLDALAFACAAQEQFGSKPIVKTNSSFSCATAYSNQGRQSKFVSSPSTLIIPSVDQDRKQPTPPSVESAPSAHLANETVATTLQGSDDRASQSNISVNDVLCGRGGLTNHHPGNVFFRKMVRHRQEQYLRASKRDKASVARDIVDTIRQLIPPGRFLKKGTSKQWTEIGDRKAREKTSQALREGAPELREELQQVGITLPQEQRRPIRQVTMDSDPNQIHEAILEQVNQQPLYFNSVTDKSIGMFPGSRTNVVFTPEEEKIIKDKYQHHIGNVKTCSVSNKRKQSLKCFASSSTSVSGHECILQKSEYQSGKLSFDKRFKMETKPQELANVPLNPHATVSSSCSLQAWRCSSSSSSADSTSSMNYEHTKNSSIPVESSIGDSLESRRGPRLKMLKSRSQHCN